MSEIKESKHSLVTVGMLNEVRNELKSEITSSRLETRSNFKKIDSRINSIDARFNEVDARFNEVDARFDKIQTLDSMG